MESGDMTLYRGCTPVVDAQYQKDGAKTPVEAIIEIQGEYLRLQPQDESDNSECIHAAIATLRFDNPFV